MMISIVIPTYNRFNKLANLLNSLIAQIKENQLGDKVEVIIVDDHSDFVVVDQIRDLLNKNNYAFLRFCSLEMNRGPSFARNYGLSQSAGEIIVFIDDDCILDQKYIIETIRVHEKHPEALVINGNLKKIRDNYLSNFWFFNYDAVFNKKEGSFYRINRLSSGNFSIKRALLEIINPLFDESLPSREDYDLYLRLREKKIGLYKSDEIIAHYDCRDSLVSFIKQRIWYSKGEYYLRKKHDIKLIIADQQEHRIDIRQRYPYLAMLLGLVWRFSMKYWKMRDRMGRIPAARNTGVMNASGDIIAIVADDYLLAPNYAETITKFFWENPNAMVVRFKIIAAEDDFFSSVSHFYFDVSVRRRLSCEEIAEEHWLENLKKKWQKLPVVEEQITTRHDLEAAGGAAFKREVFRTVGLFDESLLRAEDTDMTRRLRAQGIPVYYYPYHQIKHRYGGSAFETVSKCFNTGRNRWKYYNKYSNDSAGLYRLAVWGIRGKADALLTAFWRARQARSIGEFFLYLPFMCLFEISNKLGFFWSAVLSNEKVTDVDRGNSKELKKN